MAFEPKQYCHPLRPCRLVRTPGEEVQARFEGFVPATCNDEQPAVNPEAASLLFTAMAEEAAEIAADATPDDAEDTLDDEPAE